MKSEIPVYDIQSLNIYHKNGILIGRFAPYLEAHEHLLSAHRHNFYHLVFFTEGEGKQQIDFKTYNISKNTIYFMVPGQVHQWHFETAVDGYIVNFNADFFSNFLIQPDYIDKYPFFKGDSEHQTIVLDEPIATSFRLLFEELLQVDTYPELAPDLIKSTLLRIFTVTATQWPPQSNNSYSHTLIQNFRKLIEAHYKQLKLPKSYAALLYITPNHLNAVCKDFLGETAGHLIRNRVVLEAKRMLVNLDVTIAEISLELGFEDQSYFVKFFKKAVDLTPEKFRKINFTHYGKA